ncbi:MAG: MFS transporter [Acidimicrobiia bacterium]|nr:MFS transporter [Acidimicrobiia bacterium]
MTKPAGLIEETGVQKPSKVRYRVLTAATLASLLLYLDRVCIAKIVDSASFKADLPLSNIQNSWILGSFFFAYAFGQVPGGWLADRFGPRAMLSAYVVLWSAFTAATGLASGFVSLLLARVGFGLAQAGAYPTSGGLLKHWITFPDRAKASSTVALGGRVGGAIAPLLTVMILSTTGSWRAALIGYGLAGCALAWLVWSIVRDRPDEHHRCNPAERRLIADAQPSEERLERASAERFSVLPLLANSSMWLNCLSQFGTNMGWAFFVTLLPRYLSEVKRVETAAGGQMVSVVLFVGMGGMLLGGWLTDWVTRRLGVRWGRALPLGVSRLLAAAVFLSCLWIDSPVMLTAAFAVVAFATDLGVSCVWAYAQDVGGSHTGAVLGWGNMWGNFGAGISPVLATWVVQSWDVNQDWHEAFVLFAASFLVAGLAGLGMNATSRIYVPTRSQR